jgi:hypothetical protein
VAEAVGAGDVVVAVGVGDAGVVGLVVGVLLPVLPPVPPPVLAGMPPCSVTTIPPGLNTICADHWPLGAPLAAVAVTAMLCPAARVPEFWLSASQDTDGDADHFIGPVPVLRSRICTLFGSAARWLTLT